LKNKKEENEMPYGADNIENRFDDFVEETNKKIEELEAKVRFLESELGKNKIDSKSIINITNQEIKSSLGSTIKTIGDIVKKNNLKK
jgi:hypothetical protein